MGLPGSKPNEGQPIRHRNKERHEWIDVERRAHRGGPRLPATQPTGLPWPEATKQWWAVIRRMPHAVLWDEADWRFALDTATIVAAFHAGDMKQAVEVRQREKVLGTTLDARRDLRIRYVEPTEKTDDPRVKAIADYRKALEE